LLDNEFPDLNIDHPSLIKSIVDTVKPECNSATDIYIDSTIQFLKQQSRNRTIALNNTVTLGRNLPFAYIEIENKPFKIKTLLDSGATNSLIHVSYARKLKLNVQPCNLTLNTANGASTTAIKGLAHDNFFMTSDKKQKVPLCTTFIVTSQLTH
jgi:hypothetical protein